MKLSFHVVIFVLQHMSLPFLFLPFSPFGGRHIKLVISSVSRLSLKGPLNTLCFLKLNIIHRMMGGKKKTPKNQNHQIIWPFKSKFSVPGKKKQVNINVNFSSSLNFYFICFLIICSHDPVGFFLPSLLQSPGCFQVRNCSIELGCKKSWGGVWRIRSIWVLLSPICI